jgi:predicted acyltransferase
MHSTSNKPPVGLSPAKSSRLLSLDVFRGITIAGMILVNNPGSWTYVYPALRHAEWHGWTPTDLIYPFFLFIIGVALPYSFAKRIERGDTKPRLFGHVLFRSLVIFALGMILSGIPDYDFRNRLILDTLQRISIIYLISGTIFLLTGVAGQAIIAILCVVVYWLLMMLVPVPGYGAGVLGRDGNLWQYIDKILLAGWHFHGEGILSLIPSISTVLAGTLTGRWLKSEKSPQEKVSAILVFGNFGIVLGAIADIWFPINKLLWSSSYVIFTAGFALNLLGVCYWLVEIRGFRKWLIPFVVFGMNAIAAFFLSSLIARIIGLIKVNVAFGDASAVVSQVGLKDYIYSHFFVPLAGNLNGSLLYAITYVALWLMVMWLLYKKEIYIKI